MSHIVRLMNPRALLLLCGVLAAAVAFGAPAEKPEARFSQILTAPERAAAGLDHLTSDQVAVLDALYRRDIAAQAAPRRADVPAPSARFSQRLTDNERRTAGLDTLTETEVAQLDAFVSRNAPTSVARALLTTQPSFVPVSMRARLAEVRPTKPEIHGSFTLGMGFGKGYSERFGGMTLNYEDPDRKFAVSVSYSESHIKGDVPFYLARDTTSTGLGAMMRFGEP